MTKSVGREAEMASMLDAFKRVGSGEEREVLLISGEAGLGKTTRVCCIGGGVCSAARVTA